MNTHIRFRWQRLLVAAVALLFVTLAAGSSLAGGAATQVFNLAVIRIFTTDNPISAYYTSDQIRQAADELSAYYATLSNGTLDLHIEWVEEVHLPHNLDYYQAGCRGTEETRIPCPPVYDIIAAACDRHRSFEAVNGVLFLWAGEGDPHWAGDYPFGVATPAPADGAFQMVDVFELEEVYRAGRGFPGPSRVGWNVWAHEVGHMLVNHFANRNRASHPANYKDGYDPMDACYPCGATAYTLSGATELPEASRFFVGWLPESKVLSIPAPASGTSTVRQKLAPISQEPGSTTGLYQALKIPIVPGVYYLVEARRRLRADSYWWGPGIYDEGIHILRVNELDDPPVEVIDPLGCGVSGTCAGRCALPRQVLVYGGTDGTDALSGAELYDAETGTWSAAGEFLEGRSAHTATLLRNSRLLVVGGTGLPGPLRSSAGLYNWESTSWSATGGLTIARTGHAATRLRDGRVLVVGGRIPRGEVTASAVLYTPATGTWSDTARPMAESRVGHTVTRLDDGRVLVVGGMSAAGTILASAEIYDPLTDSWTSVHVTRYPRTGHTATRLANGRVLLVGGSNSSGYEDNAEIYNPATGTWSEAGVLPSGRVGHTATLLEDMDGNPNNDKVLVAGGYNGTYLRGAELYDPVMNSWATTRELRDGRRNHTATLLPDKRVLVAGGYDGTDYLSSAEIYNPATGTWSPTGSLSARRSDHTATLLGGRDDTASNRADEEANSAYRVDQVPETCWPYPLWHVEPDASPTDMSTYRDPVENITIQVESEDEEGYQVKVTRGVPPSGHPDVYVRPWLEPPAEGYESPDIWVDSGCNGWDVYRYTDARGKPRLSGDNPCLDHQNVIWVTIHNKGTVSARNLRVTINASDPPGVGVSGSWRTLAIYDKYWFPFGGLADLRPGKDYKLWVPWRPEADVSALETSETVTRTLHTCIQVIIDRVEGEIVFDNQDGDGEQENIDIFEAVVDSPLFAAGAAETGQAPPDAASGGTVINRSFLLNNRLPPQQQPATRTYFLRVGAQLPPAWSYQVAGGTRVLTLGPNEVRQVPVQIQIPPGAAAGQMYRLEVSADTLVTTQTPWIPAGWPGGNVHIDRVPVGGVVLEAQTVHRSQLTLAGTVSPDSYIAAGGQLMPAPGRETVVMLDYTDPAGKVASRTVVADAAGKYRDSFAATAAGTWQVQALWQGDLDHASTVSPIVTVQVLKPAVSPRAIPQGENPVSVDGVCDTGKEYADATSFVFADAAGVKGRIYLKHDDSQLYACMTGAAGSHAQRFASLYLDTDNEREAYAQSDDRSLRVAIVTGAMSSYRGTGVADGYVPVALPGWTARARSGNADTAEFAVPIELTGGRCGTSFGLAVYHHWVAGIGNDYGWPSARFYDQPQTWEAVQLVDVPCRPASPPPVELYLPSVLR